MDFIKKIIKHPWVAKFLSPQTIKILLVILIFVGMFVALYKWYRKRKAAAAAVPAKERKIASRSLVQAWKEFLRRIPREFRRAVLLYQPLVVFGEAGSGKSQLIEKYTDWRGQSYQLYPSYTENPDLQVYLGPHSVAHEIPSALLNDTSAEAKIALIRWGKTVFRKRPPIVILVLRGDTLASLSPESLKRQAQTLRGKINILSRLYRQPLIIRLVLTHMDRMDGYRELAKFLESHNIPLQIPLQGMDVANDLKNCLHAYEKYLPLALTSMQAAEYKAILQFFVQAPALFSSVALFLQIFTARELLSHHAEVSELYLVSNTSEYKLSNPFAVDLPQELLARKSQRWQHRVACGTLLVLGLGYLAFSYTYEQGKCDGVYHTIGRFHTAPAYDLYQETRKQIAAWNEGKEAAMLRIFYQAFASHHAQEVQTQFSSAIRHFYLNEWKKAQEAVDRFEAAPSDKAYEKACHTIAELAQLDELKTQHPLLTEFSRRYEKEIQAQLITGIRKFYLLPLLGKCAASEHPQEKTLYLLSLIYATKTSEIGKQILANVMQWSKNLDLAESVIKNYVTYSETPWQEPVSLPEMPLPKNGLSPANIPDPWLAFFIDVRETMKRHSITQQYMEKIRESKQPLEEVLEYARRYHLVQNLFETLDRSTRLNVRKIYEPMAMTGWVNRNREELQTFFDMLDAYPIVIPPSEQNTNLQQLITHLRGILSLEIPSREFEFKLQARQFKFSSAQWVKLIQNSKVVLLVNDFVSKNYYRQDRIFFAGNQAFPPLEMNPYSDGTGLFAGKRQIEGRYTHEAYERAIIPILQEFSDLSTILPLPDNKKMILTNFVSERAQDYATQYRRNYEEYYRAFDIRADSLPALLVILTEIQLPSSPFSELLRIIAENTALPPSPSPYLAALPKHLAPFHPVNRLVIKKDNTELQTYYTILQQMKDQLNVPAKPPKELQDFIVQLGASGRLALPILLEDRTSYLDVTQKWLTSVGIVGEWQKPFLSPVYKMYDVGQADIERAVQRSWENMVLPEIAGMLGKFPFQRLAQQNVTPVELEALLHPVGGTFWRDFARWIAPVCIKQNNKWEARSSPRESLRLPTNMLLLVNHLEFLSQVLWDKDGNPRPLLLHLKPEPLSLQMLEGKRIACLATLTVGKGCIFNFNQKPASQPLSLSWWKEESANINLEFTDTDSQTKSYFSEAANDTFWSFFRLLAKAASFKQGVWTWHLQKSKQEYNALKVQYEIEEDPWRWFAVPTLPPTGE
jgi:type VI secretion system protein ImpL